MSPVYTKQHIPKNDELQKEKQHRHKKDFSWEKKGANPFKQVKDHSSKERFILILGIGSFLTMLGLLFYHPFFHISNISVYGLQRISKEDCIDATMGIMDSLHPMLIIPGNNYFFVHIEQIESILVERFPFASISITKEFPGTLSIIIEEQLSTMIYDDSTTYSYMDITGELIEDIRFVGEDEWREVYEITTSTLADGTVSSTERLIERTHIIAPGKLHSEMGEYPIVYHLDASDVSSTARIAPEVVDTILSWQTFIPKAFPHESLYYAEVSEEGRRVALYLDPFRYLLIDATKSSEYIQERLKTIEQYHIDITSIEYIDLRFDGRVYWR